MRIALLALLLVTACRCDDSPPPIHRAEPPKPRKDEQLLSKIPGPEGTTFEASTLATVLPDKLGDATPDGAAQTETTALGEAGRLPVARRTYVKDGTRIIVQVSDMQHAPVMRQMMLAAHAEAKKAKKPSWAPATVRGYDAVLQHMPAQGIALANVAVTDRLFVNLHVDPADNAEAALPWAEQVDYEPIKKLVPPESTPAAPSP
jgi:hypothetical protein